MKYCILNHKNKMKYQETLEYIPKLSKLNIKDYTLVVVPSNIYIPLYLNNGFLLGVQNVSAFDSVSLTGDITASQIKSANINYAIVGHSERRQYYHEMEYELLKKVRLLKENDIRIVYCIGETLEEKKQNKTYDILTKQIEKVLNFLESCNDIIIAYEPVWAIGSGMVPTNEELKKIILFIKKLIKTNYNQEVSVLYGGSVNSQNIDNLKNIEEIDGFLIGSASLNVEEIKKMFS